MKLYLSSINARLGILPDEVLDQCRFALESFYYIDENHIDYFKSRKSFILDSGAFTFMNTHNSAVDWDDYVRKYADFIGRHGIGYYFEMDLDKIVGLEKVEQYRDYLERTTKTKCIPVWHRSRGLQYWKDMCQAYDYVAIGGLAIKDISRSEYPYLRELNKIAASYHTNVHGLGFTPKKLEDYGFYSVDSSSWSGGARYGDLHQFDGKKICYIHPQGYRAKNHKQIGTYNFLEWCAYQRYLERI